MTHDQVLQNKVGEVRTRIRLLVTQQWLCIALTYAMLAGLLLVAVTRLQWWTDAIDYLWALLLAGGVAGLVLGWTRRITPMVAAQIADERSGLKERLSTAVELANRGREGEIAEAQIADAARHAQELRASQVLPWRAPHQLRYLAGAAALLAAVIFLPDLPLFHSAQDRIDREVMRREGETIQKVAKEMEKRARKNEDESNAAIIRRISRNMQQLGKDQARGRISKKQAMLRMNELNKQLKEAENRIAGGNARKSMEQVSNDLMKAAEQQQQRGNSEAAKSLQQMAQNVKNRDFEGAKKQLEEMARKMQSGQMSAQDAKQAADTLQQMAQAMEGSTLSPASQQMKDAAKQLQQAAQAAREAQKKLEQAKTDAERQQIQQQMQQQMAQAMQQAGSKCEQAGGT